MKTLRSKYRSLMDTVEHSHDIREDSSSLHTLYATPPGKMRSITSHTTNRYHDSKRMIEAYMRDISPAMFSLSDGDHEQSVPPFPRRHWTPHIHPEGKLYFVREYQDSHTIRVVTETHLLAPSPDLAGICDSWIEYIQTRLEQIGVRITPHLELFIQLEGVHMSDCAHYLVDHLNKVQFWFEPVNTEVLGLPPVVSDSQLKLALCELYWSHVEHFPMHIAPQPISVLENLISVMNHGLCGNLSEGYTTWTLARLWTVIYRNRILNFHGEDCARLSRDQYVLYPRTRAGWSENVLKVLTFGIWNDFVARLDDVFVDHVVHVHLWKGLIVDCLAEWESASHAASTTFRECICFVTLLTVLSSAVVARAILTDATESTTWCCPHYICIAAKLKPLVLHRPQTPISVDGEVHCRRSAPISRKGALRDTAVPDSGSGVLTSKAAISLRVFDSGVQLVGGRSSMLGSRGGCLCVGTEYRRSNGPVACHSEATDACLARLAEVFEEAEERPSAYLSAHQCLSCPQVE
ncbi:unnamed protein product, partial [Mycena citricolor]